MASVDPSLSSEPEEHKWVVEIDEILEHQLEIDVETPPVSLFQVPETITSKKPEAYEPQQIGLGPIHHFRAQTYKKMEQKKLGVIRKVLKDYEIKDYKLHVFEKVKKLVPMVRSCYDKFLQDDDDSLARIFAIDGLFLLNLLHTYNAPKDEYLLFLKKRGYETKLSNDEYISQLKEFDSYKSELEFVIKATNPLLLQNEIVVTEDNQTEWENILKVPHHQPELPKVGPKKRLVAQDILMVENQIPFMVLKEIDETLHASSAGNSCPLVINSSPSIFRTFCEIHLPFLVLEEIDETLHASSAAKSCPSVINSSPSIFRTFCEIHSPLKLCSKSQAPSSVDHLLHYMYYSIVNNVSVPKPEVAHTLPDKMEKPEVDEDDDSDSAEDRDLIQQVHNFVTNLPREEIVQAYEQTISMLEAFTQSKTLIPSASKLNDEAGFQFHSLKDDEGIQNIDVNIDNVQGNHIYLPSINLNNDSEVILRNLVAYETLTAESDSFPFNEYMGLMCGLITNKDDVKYLKSQNVIIGDLGDDEVVKLFTEISSSIQTMQSKGKSKLGEKIDEINKVYESRMIMKAYLLLKQLARSLLVVLRAVGTFVESSWKIVAFIVSIVAVFLLISQAYCDSFGCDKKTAAILPYASG